MNDSNSSRRKISQWSLGCKTNKELGEGERERESLVFDHSSHITVFVLKLGMFQIKGADTDISCQHSMCQIVN